MHKCWKKAMGVLFCWGIMAGTPFASYADSFSQVQLVEAKESAGAEYMDVDSAAGLSAAVNAAAITSQIKVYDRTEETKASEEAELKAEAEALAEAAAKEAAAQAAQAAQTQAKADLRQQVVNFALSFLGGPYRYGGSDPATGVDCSGFTRYVMSNAAGISLSRSSKSQANDGVAISADQMQPGDLIFYGGGSGINHVAMYIGSGKIVHASTYDTGIKISNWNYRTPVKIVNVLG